MNICIIGDFSANLDEGFKNTSHYLAQEISISNQVFCLDHKSLNFSKFMNALRQTPPQVIHAITRPTYQSLYFTKLLSLRWGKAKTVISALKPEGFFSKTRTSPIQKTAMTFVRPDLTLVQSKAAEFQFREMNYRTAFLANGVDTKRFHPVSREEKLALRSKYNIACDIPVILHVGHLESARNLSALEPVKRAGMQVVVAGSLYMGIHSQLISDLKAKGLIIFEGYQPQIDELYKLADCYVFPLDPGNSLSMPLSTLEAMSCNLPVVTRRFEGLEDNFNEGQGLHFVDRKEDILPIVQNALKTNSQTKTREMVMRFSWRSISQQLQNYYQELVNA